jgi:uncharacterized DUF497 family protein
MRIVWDEPKRLANIAKHGLDFLELENAFDLGEAVIRPARPSRDGRPRWRAIGVLNGRLVSVIFSRLGTEAVAIISLRPAHKTERADHDRR